MHFIILWATSTFLITLTIQCLILCRSVDPPLEIFSKGHTSLYISEPIFSQRIIHPPIGGVFYHGARTCNNFFFDVFPWDTNKRFHLRAVCFYHGPELHAAKWWSEWKLSLNFVVWQLTVFKPLKERNECKCFSQNLRSFLNHLRT